MWNKYSDWISFAWLYWGLVIVYAITIISIVGIVLSENRNPLKSLAWVCVLILFPVGGLILYIFFGRNLKNTRMISRRKRRKLIRNEITDFGLADESPDIFSPESHQLMRLGKSLTGAFVFKDNHIRIFKSGCEMFNTLLCDIENAEHYIHLQFYIIKDDSTGLRLTEILERKARQGVSVRVIYDDIGSMGLTRSKMVKRLRESGVEIFPFSRVVFPPFATRINWRNHRKVVAIDGSIGYIGGMNIADRYMETGMQTRGWRDCHLRVTGDAVAALQYSFAVDWNFMGHPLLIEPLRPEAAITPHDDISGAVQMVTSGPTSKWSNIEIMMLNAISSARKRVLLATPYFLPTESLLRALQTAALAKVDVRIMMPAHSDSVILTYASRSYIEECLRAGIKIYLYEGGMLHSKYLIVDDEIATVGSTNFDFRSFEHNFEANVVIYSKEFNTTLSKSFFEDEEGCKRIKASKWRRRPLTHKARESLTRLLSPIL